MNIDIFTRYSELGASSRLRYFRWQKHWAEYGIRAEFHPFFNDGYLRSLYSGKKRRLSTYLKSLGKCIASTLRCRKNPCFIEYELLPGIPAGAELTLLGKRKYLLGFDDRVEIKYANSRILQNKYADLISRASGVVCANAFLAQWAKKYNSNVIEIPTVVETGNYPAFSVEKNPEFTVVWIGNPATAHYLENAAPALREMAKKVDFELLAIGVQALHIPGVSCRCEKWSEESEGRLLASAHIGIMPLPADDQFAVGKSAYKLIQYMAAGIPAIASPVGENKRVIREGINGFFADSPEEWQQAFCRLADNAGLRQEMGYRTRRIAEEEYSYAAYVGKFADFIKTALE